MNGLIDNDRLRWRNIEVPCATCKGSGIRWYSSTSTWRGGIGGAAMTVDVCDACWGSGDTSRPWTDLRALKNNYKADVEKAYADWFAQQLGVGLRTLRPALLALRDTIERESRRRKPPVDGYRWSTVTKLFASILTAMLTAAERPESGPVAVKGHQEGDDT